MNNPYYIIFVTLLLYIASASAQTDIYLSDETPYSWTPASTETVNVLTDEGYLIAVNVTKCNLVNGQYVTISDGTDETNLEKQLLFSYNLYKNYSFLYNGNKVISKFTGSAADAFTAIFTRMGTVTTTLEPPTTDVDVPTASPEDLVNITVHVYGKEPSEFNSTTTFYNTFRKAVANMAIEYCNTENINLNASITLDNVKIEDVDQCPISWKEKLCTRLIFRLPVSIDDSRPAQWDGYQLNAHHLEIMWWRLFNKYIAPLGLREESGPNFDSMMTTRVVVVSLILVIFVMVVLIVKVAVRIARKKKSAAEKDKRLSDTKSILSNDESRFSQSSMEAHYLQETPPGFESTYSLYNPGDPMRDSACYSDLSNFESSYGPGSSNRSLSERGGIIVAQMEDADEINGTSES